jgi:hypothetical protein
MMDNLEKQLAVVSKRLDSDELWVLRDVVDKAIAELTSLRQYKAEAESQKIDCWRWDDFNGDKGIYDCPVDVKYGESIGRTVKPLYARPVPAGSCAVPQSVSKALEWLYEACSKYGNIPDEHYAAVTNAATVLSAIPSNSEGEKS